MDYSFGDFSFINDQLTRQTLEHDFKVINEYGKEAWYAFYIHDPYKSFIYDSKSEILSEVSDKLYPGHSGASYGLSMRTFEYIAKHGWDKYVITFKK